MPSRTSTTTEEDGAPQLAAIQQRYERAKARIARDAVPAGSDDRVPDTIAVDVRITKPPLTAARQGADRDPAQGVPRAEDRSAPAAEAPQRGPRRWLSLRMPRLAGRSLPAS